MNKIPAELSNLENTNDYFLNIVTNVTINNEILAYY